MGATTALCMYPNIVAVFLGLHGGEVVALFGHD